MSRPEEHDGEREARGPRPGELSALLEELASAPAERTWDDALRPGAVIGRFELIRELGRGGFGVVWEACDRVLGRHVAFKAVRAGPRRDLREERLLHEAEAAARLSHPNIVALHDVGRSEHGPYLVLELLAGRTLADRLALGVLPLREAIRIGLEIAQGLAHAHAHGVVHRDLKPENVLLCDDGQVKIVDFGMAHAFGWRRAEGGTPAYMAPEQAEGSPEDERTDVFALGEILFRMLSGKLPFEDERALRSRSSAPFLEVPGEPALGELVARMLAKRAAERPRDGGEVLAALKSFASELDRASAPAGPVRARTRRRLGRWMAGGVGLAVVVTAAGTWWVRDVGPGAAPGPTRERSAVPSAGGTGAAAAPSIAVLPFADLSPGRNQEYFSDGIAEEILNALAQVEGLRVAGRTSSFSFKGRNEDLRTIGQRLNVSTILDGSVRMEGQHVRISAEIVNAADGYRLWSRTFDRELTGVFAVQDEIARGVVEALRVDVLPGKAPSTKYAATSDPEAHRLNLLGHQLILMGTLDGTRRAVAVLEKAVALDPSYAEGWARLANARGNLALSVGTEESVALQRRALDAAQKAVAVGPSYGEGYGVRGWLRTMFNWEWTEALGDLERAVVLSPGSALVHSGYSVLLADLGRLEAAVAQSLRCLEIDPLSSVDWGNLGSYYTELGDLPRARSAFNRALEISPDNDVAAYGLGLLELFEGHAGEALRRFEREPDEVRRLRGIAIAQHALGHRRESDRALNDLVARARDRDPYQVARVHAWRGERERAFEWLERAYAQHDAKLRYLKADPLLRGLRGDPRFTALLRKVGLPLD